MSLQKDEGGHQDAFHVSGPRWRVNGGSSINIVLVGYTGNGKSATGNTIIGGRPFLSMPSACSVTLCCQLASKQLSDSQTINVIDTPGFGDALPQRKEVTKCFDLAKNEIHAFLLVVSVRSKFLKDEASSFSNLQTKLGTNFIDYVIVVFTGGDDLEDQNTTFADYLENDCADQLKDIIRACGNRCILFDNRSNDELKNDEQVQQLLSQIDTIRNCNGGIHFEPYEEDEEHVDGFHVSAPRWRKNYKRAALACFVKAAYMLELDRQEKRSAQDALAPGWWIPFKFKFLRSIIDPGDGTIIGVILEWNQSERASRPSGAPEAVLALRGTLLKPSTGPVDMGYNTAIPTIGSFKGTPRYKIVKAEMMSLINLYGSSNVCVAGHSLGAAFALELVAKVLVKECKIVEVHAFNPPCPILHGMLGNFLLSAVLPWTRIRLLLKRGKTQFDNDETETIPHVYVNTGDFIALAYRLKPTPSSVMAKLTLVKTKIDNMVLTAKLHTLRNENENPYEAHRIAQWWSNDLNLKIKFVYSD